MTDFEPEEHQIHQIFEALREGWRKVRTDLVDRIDERIDQIDERYQTPPPDRIVGRALLMLVNITSRLLGRQTPED